MARHLAKLQANADEGAGGVDGLLLLGRDVLDLGRGVLLVGRVPALGLLGVPRLERVVAVLGMAVMVSVLVLFSLPEMEGVTIRRLLLVLSVAAIAQVTAVTSGGKTGE